MLNFNYNYRINVDDIKYFPWIIQNKKIFSKRKKLNEIKDYSKRKKINKIEKNKYYF